MTMGVGSGLDGGWVLVFDVLGSLLDEDAGQRRAVQTVLDLSAPKEERFVDRWSTRFNELVAMLGAGERPYRRRRICTPRLLSMLRMCCIDRCRLKQWVG